MNAIYDIIGLPLGYLMSWIYSFVGNYGLSILLFTLVTKIILFPISYHTQKSSARMKLINPKIAKLQKSYSNNPTKLQEETQKLYQKEGVNPNASCMPMIVQTLLLFGVLDVVYKPLTHILHITKSVRETIVNIASEIVTSAGGKPTSLSDLRCELIAIEQINKPGNLSKFNSVSSNIINNITDFSNNFRLFGADLSKTPQLRPDTWNHESVVLFLIPIFAGLTQLLFTIYTQIYQKKNNPDTPTIGCMNIMLYLMPLMSVWWGFTFPAAVGFYWICSSILSFLTTFVLNLYFTDKRIEKVDIKEKEKARRKAEKHPEKKTFMQRMLEQQELLEQQQKGTGQKSENGKVSRSEMNKYNRERINEARKRMAEKYGDEYDEKDDD